LFGLPFDKIRYQETVKHCSLLTDFQQLPLGDKTPVGERGCNLSGGQRARVNLARAVYRNAQIYLLDDVLSAVDAHVGKYLFDECLGPNGYLAKRKAARILITHQVHFLKEADWIIVIEKGKILRQGTWNEVKDIDLFQYISTPSDENDICMEKGKQSRLNDRDIPYIDDDDDDDDNYDDGAGSKQGYLKLKTSESKKSLSIASSNNDLEQYNENEGEEKMFFWKVFYEYFRAGATVYVLLFMVLFLIFSQFVTSACDYFLKIFTNEELLRLQNMETLFTTTEALYVYGFLIIAVVIATLSRGFMFFAICMRSSKKIHDKSFLRLLHSPMRFFDLNPTGRILNRFSKDIGAVDELLPKAIIEACQVN
jgi:ABC-type multidrug transport system fused ATPase/permease subunit